MLREENKTVHFSIKMQPFNKQLLLCEITLADNKHYFFSEQLLSSLMRVCEYEEFLKEMGSSHV